MAYMKNHQGYLPKEWKVYNLTKQVAARSAVQSSAAQFGAAQRRLDQLSSAQLSAVQRSPAQLSPVQRSEELYARLKPPPFCKAN